VQNKHKQKIGILGGGQLGKMLCQAGSKMGLDISVLEKDHSFPAYQVCSSFVCGDITSYDDVISFGSKMDIITIEIENVNVEALEDLEKAGKKVYPSASALKIIRDKKCSMKPVAYRLQILNWQKEKTKSYNGLKIQNLRYHLCRSLVQKDMMVKEFM
jgi:phosphoribosylaminoimidazole carboxylase (NCAIR synthetase)